jgi:hypothetical protein
LRAYCARVLGYDRTQAIEDALRSIHLGITHRAALVIVGDGGDLVPIAQGLHRRTLGQTRPFVVANPRRGNVHETVRSAMNYASGVMAVRAARGGSLCVHVRRLPSDYRSLVTLVRTDPEVQIVVCAPAADSAHPFLIRPVPIRIPSLRSRTGEVERIVEEFGEDAIKELSAHAIGFTPADRDWVLAHCASSLHEIEKGTRRLVALRHGGNINRAAALLGMSHVGLSQWFERRSGPKP